MNDMAKWGFTLVVFGHEVVTIIFWRRREAEREEHGVSAETVVSRRVVGFRGRKAA